MKRILTFFFAVAVLCSCEKTESINMVEANNLTEEALLTTLDGSKWRLVNCPDAHLVNLNGHAECDYFAELEFKDQKVFIKHNSDQAPTPHHICSTEGGTIFPLSVQACSNTTWSPWFYWNITSYNASTLKLNLQDLNFYPDYNGEFTFEKM